MIEEMEAYAKENHVPIMVPDGINYLVKYVKDNNVKSILEIGTAIGYSAIRMASVNKDIHVVSIERDIERYNEAIKNIKKCHMENQIEVKLVDALEVDMTGAYDLIFIDAAKSQYTKFFDKFSPLLTSDGTIEIGIEVKLVDALEVDMTGAYDLIFIDAAKSQYTKFFDKFSPLLTSDGTIVTDNLDFHGYRANMDMIKSRNLRQMMRKLNSYIDFLKDNKEFTTTFVEVGDGLGITKRSK